MARIVEDVGTTSAVPANSAGSGAIDGIGVGVRGEPGVKKNKKRLRQLFPIIKRKPPEVSK